jgi:hypothetical protein
MVPALFIVVAAMTLHVAKGESVVVAEPILSGTWKNELGSIMRLWTSSGQLTGVYESTVGEAKYTYPLVGAYNRDNNTTTVAFVVAWVNGGFGDSNSATAWSGQLSEDGTIHTTWMLTKLTDLANLWQSTIVGTNVFVRQRDEKCL